MVAVDDKSRLLNLKEDALLLSRNRVLRLEDELSSLKAGRCAFMARTSFLACAHARPECMPDFLRRTCLEAEQ